METLGQILAVVDDEKQQQRLREVLHDATLTFVRDEREALVAAVMGGEPDVLLVSEHRRSTVEHIVQQFHFSRYVPVVHMLSGHGAAAASRLQPVASIEDVLGLRRLLIHAISRHEAVMAFAKAFDAQVPTSAIATNELTESERAVLESIGFEVDASFDPTPMAKGAAHYAKILSESLTTIEAGKRLNVQPSRVRQRLIATPPELYGIQHKSEWRLPAFQFSKQGLVPNISAVIAKLPEGMDPVAVDNWFRLPNVDLEHGDQTLSPLEWLAQGLPAEPVAELAEDL